MPGGYKNINGNDGNTFSSDNQPTNRRGPSLVTRLKSLMESDPERAEKILEALLVKAEKGDLKAVEIIMDRIDGKAKQHIGIEPQRTIVIDFTEGD